LEYGTDYLTSPPKEGGPRNFTQKKSNGFGRVRTRELGEREGERIGDYQLLVGQEMGERKDVMCVQKNRFLETAGRCNLRT
jgi:hypothetical protein